MQKEKILLTGAGGQIGTVLTASLRAIYGSENVVATDLRPLSNEFGPTETLDVLDGERLDALCGQYKISQIYHLAAILSATGEKIPMKAWNINMTSLFNVLEVARNRQLNRVYFPSSIAVFGLESPKLFTPQFGALIPETVYGISKAAGENWSNYYFKKYGLDVRSLRYPGIVGWQSLPGGGTTDYAVEIYHKALKSELFTCFLTENTRLPMIYMDDAIRATIELMDAPSEKIKVRTSYNLASMSFTPAEIAASIRRKIPDFQMICEPDFRQAIADSWSSSIDDSAARRDWGWLPKFDLDSMTDDMILQLR
jgi:threonine 3-dehydrogenase